MYSILSSTANATLYLSPITSEEGGLPRGFGDSGRRAIYFQGFGEKGHSFSGIWGESRVLGSREQGAEEKHFRELGRKVIFLSGSREQRPPPLGDPQEAYVFLLTSVLIF